MSINFTTLFQDSWNFMRNQKQFTLFFILAFILIFFAAQILANAGLNDISQQLQNNIDLETNSDAMSNLAFQNFLIYALNLFIACWGLSTIHQISQRQPFNLVQSAVHSLKRLIGVMLIYFLSLAFMLVGGLSLYLAIAQKIAPSALALILTIIGIFIFVRLCLVPTRYLLQNESIFASIKFIWVAARQKGFTLLIFCLLINIFLPLIASNIIFLFNFLPALLTTLLSAFISATMSLFSLIFTYRFYILFIQKA